MSNRCELGPGAFPKAAEPLNGVVVAEVQGCVRGL